jgi:DNA-directed RNA polymerase specialized sigma24 family protein
VVEGTTATDLGAEEAFAVFFAGAEPTLRRALVAAYGPDGRDGAADALAYAWEHWARVGAMANAAGYLYRVGQSRMRWYRRRPTGVRPESAPDPPGERLFEPGLGAALDQLSRQQRVAVVLCHGFGLTHREVAALLGVAPSTVQNHVERGVAKLRARLEVSEDA